jgi:hypothetical protein
MKQVSTAEQFLRFKSNISEDKTSVEYLEYLTDCEVEEIMIEFAKLHVKAALEAASENAMGVHCTDYIDPDSITEAYPESNIK